MDSGLCSKVTPASLGGYHYPLLLLFPSYLLLCGLGFLLLPALAMLVEVLLQVSVGEALIGVVLVHLLVGDEALQQHRGAHAKDLEEHDGDERGNERHHQGRYHEIFHGLLHAENERKKERKKEREREREKERNIKEQPDEKFRPRRGDRESTLWSATALSVVAEIER